jgi:hypothetical protein
VEFHVPPARWQKLEQVVLGERGERGRLAAAFAADFLLRETPVTNAGNGMSAVGNCNDNLRILLLIHFCTPEEDRHLKTRRILL